MTLFFKKMLHIYFSYKSKELSSHHQIPTTLEDSVFWKLINNTSTISDTLHYWIGTTPTVRRWPANIHRDGKMKNSEVHCDSESGSNWFIIFLVNCEILAKGTVIAFKLSHCLQYGVLCTHTYTHLERMIRREGCLG